MQENITMEKIQKQICTYTKKETGWRAMMWVVVTEPGCNKEQQVTPTAEPPLLPKESVLAYI